MTIISPSVVRLEQPISECARILNTIGCQSIHVDICQGYTLPGFFSLDEMRPGSLSIFNACVTMHLFQMTGDYSINLSFLRKTDLAVFHVFPYTTINDVLNFFEVAQLIGCRLGLSIDLEVDLSAVEIHMPSLDTIFVMGIPVATCGLQPDQSMIDRLTSTIQLIAKCNPRCRLGLDGGVNAMTFPRLIQLVDELVIGSLLLQTDDIVAQWVTLTSMAKGGTNANKYPS